MKVSPAGIEGAFLIRPDKLEDERGYFARTFCVRELEKHLIDPKVVQRSVSYNKKKGTLRGMHYQTAPHEENKFVSCISGSIYDVLIDLRAGSPTYRRWSGAVLSAATFDTLFVPQGCAHGFLTLSDEAIVHYEISEFHHPESARGVCYDDPAFGVVWPSAPIIMNAKDRSYPPYPG